MLLPKLCNCDEPRMLLLFHAIATDFPIWHGVDRYANAEIAVHHNQLSAWALGANGSRNAQGVSRDISIPATSRRSLARFQSIRQERSNSST